MKNLLLAAGLAAIVGCGTEQTIESTSTNPPTEQSYADALQVYRAELEILDDLHEKQEKFYVLIDEQLSAEGVSADEFQRISADKKKFTEAMGEKIAKQQAKVDRAKADLEAAEARRN